VHEGATRTVGQANNVFVFPGLGLGAIVSEARQITDQMVRAAAHALADSVDAERLVSGALYPSVGSLRSVSRSVALAVAREAIRSGHAGSLPDAMEAEIDAAMWWPAYVPYLPA
jgi:malic enzyme